MNPKTNQLFQPQGDQLQDPSAPGSASQGRVKDVAGRVAGFIKNLSDKITPKLDLSPSDYEIEGTEEERLTAKQKVFDRIYLTYSEIDEKRFGKYAIFRDIYENNLSKYTNIFGAQEINKRGHIRAVYNYLSQTVDKITNFVTSKSPITTVPPLEADDPVEVERATSIRYFLDKVHHQNRFKYFFKRSAHIQSLFGDTFIEGPYWDPAKKCIKYTWVEDLGQVMIGWRDNRFEEIDWYGMESLQSVDSIKEQYGLEDVAPYEGRVINGTYTQGSPTKRWTERTDRQTMVQEAKVTKYWDSEIMMVIINESDVVQYVHHDYGFIPFQKLENIHVDNRPWGKSDVEELLDANVELNERMGDAGDSIRQGAVPRFKVINDPNFDVDSVKAGANGQFIFVNGEKADVGPMQSSVNISPYEMYIKNIMQIIYDLGLPAVAWGGHSAAVTGRALDMQYQAITDKIENKRVIWEMGLELLNERILILAEKYIKGMKKIIDGHYVTEYEWSEVLPTSMSDTIVNVSNKRDRGIISFHTALKELGYKDPDAELDLIVQEWSDPKLAPIMAKNALLTEGVQETIKDVFGRPGAIPIPPKTTISLNGGLTPEQEAIQASHIGLGESEGAQGRFANNVPSGAQEIPGSNYPVFTEMSQDAPSQSNPTMQAHQNENPSPMSAPGVSIAGQASPMGSVDQANQNMQASGQ